MKHRFVSYYNPISDMIVYATQEFVESDWYTIQNSENIDRDYAYAIFQRLKSFTDDQFKVIEE